MIQDLQMRSRKHSATTEQVDRRVVDEVPDAATDDSMPAFVDLRCLDNLLLKRGWVPPIDHEAGAFVLVGREHEARVMWSKARREHTCTPWPPCFLKLH